ncbi:arginine N-succinyltransferase [Salinisphaera sp. Q1T1-3]|uniref:arginine N-succinyltransferase n=1 Tax=Salinisphaera sp. Q1T1-3 TaxID=2321229 RepID=UPI000E72381A|nr:arginine N-succinyltransferase [Salinisphaera sp. Q1T1-3]RJS91891.1 arginine N-succinyltransferase [Salinisphaera sp. Q1T1-3]
MYLVRPGKPTDLDALVALAAGAQPPLTNLPAHRDRLRDRLTASEEALSASVAAPNGQIYVFVLEYAGEVVGTASIRARAGAREAYYTWRRETLIHASQQLDVRREVAILSLSHELSEASLLCAFSIAAEHRGTIGERLLRRARLMFVAQHPERFMPGLAVAMPGPLDETGTSAFWEAVGRHFFVKDFGEINEMAGIHSKSFIAEVMPPFPLYEPLLSETGRAAIGAIHARHVTAAADLRAEGFADSRHIDLFDGGLLLECTFERLNSVRNNRWHPVTIDNRHAPPPAATALLANQQCADYRCIAAPYTTSGTGQLCMTSDDADALALSTGRAVLAAPLHPLDRGDAPC